MPNDLPPTPPDPSDEVVTSPAVGPTRDVSAVTGLTSNVAAVLAVVFMLIGGIVLLYLEKRDRFVRFWAMQSVIVGLAYLAFSFFTHLVYMVFHGPLGFISFFWAILAWFVGLAFFVLYIVMIVKAFGGTEWEVPVAGKIARQQLGRIQF